MSCRWTLVIWVATLAAQGCAQSDDRQLVTVATHVLLAADTSTDLRPPEALRAVSDNNEVCLTPEPPYRVDLDRWALVAPTGIANVPVVRISSGKATVELKNRSSYGDDLCFSADVGETIGGPFDFVRVESKAVLRLSKVEWRSTHK